MALKVIHGIGRTKAEATILAVIDRAVWIAPTHGGRLKFDLKLLPDAAPDMRVRFVQLGDVIQKVERLS